MQKCWMCGVLHKPFNMPVRDCVTQVIEINKNMSKHAGGAGTKAAPVKLPKDKLMDLLAFRTPAFWQRQMIIQNVDPLTPTVFVHF
jgi:hypothetical protein